MQDRRDLQAELQRLVETLRAVYGDAVIATRVTHCDERAIIAHASIVTGAGPASSGLGSAPSEDGAAELAENRAILRALIALGVPIPADEPAKLTGPTAVDPPGRVVQFPTHEPEPPPREEPLPPTRAGRSDPTPPSRGAQPTPAPSGTGSTAAPRSTPTSAPPTSAPPTSPRSAASPTASPASAPTASPTAQAGPDDDPEAADLSWTAFWKWAREHGYSNKMALEEALNGTLGTRSPGEVRKLMREQLNIEG